MKQFVKAWIKNHTKSTLARNTIWMFLGQGVRLLLQAAYFIVIARTLGVQDYGAFVGVAALVAAVSPIVGNGAASLLVKNVSRDKSLFPVYWGNGLVLVLGSGLLLSIVILAISHFVLPKSIPIALTALICLSDAVLLPLLDLASLAYQAFERLERFAQLNVLSMASRLCAAVSLAFSARHANAFDWSHYYVTSTLFSAFFAVALASYELGFPRSQLSRIFREAKEGFYFAISQSARTIYNDIDKTMLARLSTLEATGIYGAAYRLIDVSFAPIRSLLFAAYPKFFQHGERGLNASFDFAKRLMSKAVLVSFLIFVLIMASASLVPSILGVQYAHCAVALRWLALLPLLKTIHHLTADALTGAGYQGFRTSIQVLVAAFNVGINLWLIPAYGWHGAAWASIASDGLLAILMYLSVTAMRFLYRPATVIAAPLASEE